MVRDIEHRIEVIMANRLGVSMNSKGYIYLKSALVAAIDNPALLSSGRTNELIAIVADHHEAVPHCVYANILGVVRRTWLRSAQTVYKELFPCIEYRPRLVDYLQKMSKVIVNLPL